MNPATAESRVRVGAKVTTGCPGEFERFLRDSNSPMLGHSTTATRFRQSSCLAASRFALIDCSPIAETGARNVLLVTIETLRADHLGSYGYDRPTSAHR